MDGFIEDGYIFFGGILELSVDIDVCKGIERYIKKFEYV